jgi:hypothetical protein
MRSMYDWAQPEVLRNGETPTGGSTRARFRLGARSVPIRPMTVASHRNQSKET